MCTVVFAFLAGCGDTEDSSIEVEESGKPVVYVPVAPYQEIANRLAGDFFEVRALVGEMDDPHVFSPTPKQVAQLAKSAVLFTGEMPFEEGLTETLSDGNSKTKIFSLTHQVELLEGHCEHPHEGDDDEVFVYVKGQDAEEPGHDDDHHDHDHDHDHKEGDHDHDHHAHHDHDHDHHHHEHEMDPHVWLSPRILKTQATTMAGVLKNMTGSEEAAQIDANLKEIHSDLDSLDRELTEKLALMKGQTFYVYHGAFAYFAQAYGLVQQAIELGGKRPEPKRLAELIEQAKESNVKLIFVQPQFDQSSAKSLAEAIAGKVVPLDPLERDVIANLRKIAETIGQGSSRE